jgi:hypothetical protein
MRYPYRVRVTRASTTPGTYNPDTGEYTPSTSAETVLLDCPAIVQDSGESVPRGATGMPVKKADATVIVPRSYRDDLLSCEPQDVTTVFYPNSDRIAEGNVVEVTEFNQSLFVVYR